MPKKVWLAGVELSMQKIGHTFKVVYIHCKLIPTSPYWLLPVLQDDVWILELELPPLDIGKHFVRCNMVH